MSIAAMKRRRKQHKIRNRHLAKLGRPGLPKKLTVEQSAKILQERIGKLRKIAANKARKAG